jgi:2-C-methyl-D-erythritol 4-phosphate cytidylyltransferase
MRYGMVVLAGGVGERMGRPVPKQFLLLGGMPLLIHVLEKVRRVEAIETVVITCPEKHLDDTAQLLRNHRLAGTRFTCIVGGTTRQESVYLGLQALDGIDSVILHEAVRPLATAEEFRQLIGSDDEDVIYGTSIPFTVLKGHEYVEELLEREQLVNVQLPQKFDRRALLDAHEAARRDGREFTEDASLLVSYTGRRVRILPGSTRNIKITHPVDMVTSEAIYADLMGRGT